MEKTLLRTDWLLFDSGGRGEPAAGHTNVFFCWPAGRRARGVEALGDAGLSGLLERFKRETWVFSLLLKLVLVFLQSCGFLCFLGANFVLMIVLFGMLTFVLMIVLFAVLIFVLMLVLFRVLRFVLMIVLVGVLNFVLMIVLFGVLHFVLMIVLLGVLNFVLMIVLLGC